MVGADIHADVDMYVVFDRFWRKGSLIYYRLLNAGFDWRISSPLRY